MTATSSQTHSHDAQQWHELALHQAAVDTCTRSPNRDRIDTSVLAAKLYAARAADVTMMPQTIFRTADTSGWWHTNCHASVLTKAEVFATILPARYFH